MIKKINDDNKDKIDMIQQIVNATCAKQKKKYDETINYLITECNKFTQ